ncbi:hypothetical protein [Natrialba sp. INN-245]|uniref:hypothetical protein n=1 Tax=Natrialba sp. INN-245 TaxID=2690967 RepID=UPI001313B13E|nr:hypothetical protein [Natrialba sp. INN-245]MWV38211.1 hypothetical protein [Natrialba sp. INN-245]
MSANEDEEIPGREIAYRLFAAEYDDATLSHTESDEERAPNYVVSPTGARLNRLFVVGTLTEVTSVNDEMLRARVVDPTGAFVVYAGQYQPDELATLESLEAPAFVAVTGKARTFQPEDSDQVYTSIRPESIATVDPDTRDRWVVSAAEQTVERIGAYAGAAELEASGDDLTDALLEAGVENGLAAGIPLAQRHYGTTPSYLRALRDCAIEAVEVVAGERDQVSGLAVGPEDSRDDGTTFDSLADLTSADVTDLDVDATTDTPTESVAGAGDEATSGTDPESATNRASGVEASSSVVGTASASGGSTTDTDDEAPSAAVESGTDSGAESVGAVSSDAPESELDSESTFETDSEGEPDSDATEAEPDSEATGAEQRTKPTQSTSDDDADETDESTGDDGGTDESVAEQFDAADEMYEMDDEERERLEAEFGTEFTTGSEVDDPGKADIDVPEDGDSEAGADTASAKPEAATSGADGSDESDELGAPPQSRLEDDPDAATDLEADENAAPADSVDEPADSSEDGAADEDIGDEMEADPAADDESEDDASLEDVDLQERVVETMGDLDDGDGANRAAVVETVSDETGVAADDVEDAIQDALMSGRCYEPDDGTLKPI